MPGVILGVIGSECPRCMKIDNVISGNHCSDTSDQEAAGKKKARDQAAEREKTQEFKKSVSQVREEATPRYNGNTLKLGPTFRLQTPEESGPQWDHGRPINRFVTLHNAYGHGDICMSHLTWILLENN